MDEKSEDIIKATVSSGSMPFVFQPQVWADKDQVLMDGGTEWNVNLVSAINKCREKVEDDSDIVLDIIDCSTYHAKKYSNIDALDMFLRRRAIKNYYNSMNDITEFKNAFPDIDFRYFFHPSEKFKGMILEFN